MYSIKIPGGYIRLYKVYGIRVGAEIEFGDGELNLWILFIVVELGICIDYR